MSIQQTIDQERAALAWKAIEDVNEKPEDFKKPENPMKINIKDYLEE